MADDLWQADGVTTTGSATDATIDPPTGRDAVWLELAWSLLGGDDTPVTAGWLGPRWAVGGVLVLVDATELARVIDVETWCRLSDNTEEWLHSGRSIESDRAWIVADSTAMREGLQGDTWRSSWFARFLELAGTPIEEAAVVVVGDSAGSIEHAGAVVAAARPALVLTSSERLAHGVELGPPGGRDTPVIVVFDAGSGTTLDRRRLGFNEWALAAAAVLR